MAEERLASPRSDAASACFGSGAFGSPQDERDVSFPRFKSSRLLECRANWLDGSFSVALATAATTLITVGVLIGRLGAEALRE